MFVTNIPQPRINGYNFAVNSRCYNPANTQPLYRQDLLGATNYQWSEDSVNGDTAMGQSWFH